MANPNDLLSLTADGYLPRTANGFHVGRHTQLSEGETHGTR